MQGVRQRAELLAVRHTPNDVCGCSIFGAKSGTFCLCRHKAALVTLSASGGSSKRESSPARTRRRRSQVWRHPGYRRGRPCRITCQCRPAFRNGGHSSSQSTQGAVHLPVKSAKRSAEMRPAPRAKAHHPARLFFEPQGWPASCLVVRVDKPAPFLSRAPSG
jgi:hypothetical protein